MKAKRRYCPQVDVRGYVGLDGWPEYPAEHLAAARGIFVGLLITMLTAGIWFAVGAGCARALIR